MDPRAKEDDKEKAIKRRHSRRKRGSDRGIGGGGEPRDQGSSTEEEKKTNLGGKRGNNDIPPFSSHIHCHARCRYFGLNFARNKACFYVENDELKRRLFVLIADQQAAPK